MTGITEAAFKKYWAVAAVVAAVVFGGAAWATKVNADIERLAEKADGQEEAMQDVAEQIRLLREALIRAGTALPDPKTGR